MPRQFVAAILGAVVVAILVVAILVATSGKGTPTTTPPTPVPTVQPLPTQSGGGKSHQAKLTPAFAKFVNKVCHAFQAKQAGVLENEIMYYQYNTEVYYSPFNLSSGFWALPTVFKSWLHGTHIHCVRVAEPYERHGVIVTKGWNQSMGHWAIIDVDIPPGRADWRLNDFTFGNRAHVMGAFFATNGSSVRYGSRV